MLPLPLGLWQQAVSGWVPMSTGAWKPWSPGVLRRHQTFKGHEESCEGRMWVAPAILTQAGPLVPLLSLSSSDHPARVTLAFWDKPLSHSCPSCSFEWNFRSLRPTGLQGLRKPYQEKAWGGKPLDLYLLPSLPFPLSPVPSLLSLLWAPA